MPALAKLSSSSGVRFSDDGSRLVSLGRRIALWDVLEGKRVAAAPQFSNPVSADFSPDGALLAIKNTSGDVLVLAVPDLSVAARLSGAGIGEGAGIRFTADGRHLVDASWTGILMVRDAIDGSIVWAEKGPSVSRLVCTRDRMTWAYDRVRGRGQTFVRVWPFDAHEPEAVASIGGPLAVAVSDDGARVAAVSDGLQVSDRHADSGDWCPPTRVFAAPFDGQEHAVGWAPNGDLVYAHEFAVHVFDRETLAPRGVRMAFHVLDFAISPDESTAAFAGREGGLVVDWPLDFAGNFGEVTPSEEPRESGLVAQLEELHRQIHSGEFHAPNDEKRPG